MLAEKDSYIDDAAQRFYEACVDFSVRENLRAKREYEIREQRAVENEVKLAALQDNYDSLQNENRALQDDYDSLQDENRILQDEIDDLRARLSKYESQDMLNDQYPNTL